MAFLATRGPTALLFRLVALKGKTVAIDSTMLEANVAMKSIERKDTGEDWKGYLTRLAKEAGIENPSDTLSSRTRICALHREFTTDNGGPTGSPVP